MKILLLLFILGGCASLLETKHPTEETTRYIPLHERIKKQRLACVHSFMSRYYPKVTLESAIKACKGVEL
jgi:hypothetical protein